MFIVRCYMSTQLVWWIMSFSIYILYVFILCLYVDFSVSPILQRLWHSAVVSSSFYASADKDGPCTGWAHRQVPLVCSLVPSPLLLAPSLPGAGPLTGRLAGDGQRWGSFPWCDRLHRHGKCVAVPQSPSPARQAPELGLLAPVDALSQTARPPDHQGDSLLQTGVSGGEGRGGRGAHHDTGNLCQPKEEARPAEDTAGIWQPSPGLPGWEQTRCAGSEVKRTGEVQQHSTVVGLTTEPISYSIL